MVSLLVSEPGARPRIAEYRGRAALRTWLATVAANTTLNQVRLVANQPYDSLGGVGAAVAGVEPELALAKARYAADLDVSLRDAVAALDERWRVILSLHHVKGWTVDRLATMYRVSRSAAGRLLVEARDALLEETKRRLHARLKLTPSELESLVVALQSDLQVSLVRMLDGND
jgi:RNA polymerase sigma-70 factor (ECF subfamily)